MVSWVLDYGFFSSIFAAAAIVAGSQARPQ
jgi:hypothetical protein